METTAETTRNTSEEPSHPEPAIDETAHEEKPEFDIAEFFCLSQTEDETPEQIAAKIEDKLGIGLAQMHEALSQSVQKRAEELTLDFINIAPLGDYEKLLEDNDRMCVFLKTEGHKPEHWKLVGIRLSEVSDLLSFGFHNMGVDDGTTLTGFVFVSKGGKIKHAFAQVER